MDTLDLGTIIDAGQELERGLACALAAHYADAAAHFARARALLPPDRRPLLASLDAFVAGHARYWQAQQALHEASRSFAVALTEQQGCLADLQRILPGTITSEHDGSLDRGLMLTYARPSAAPPPWSPPPPDGEDETLRGLRITCFGRFAVWRSGRPVVLCQNRNGRAILRFLAAQPRHRATMDALMDALWPEDPPETARHKLHCASSALRRALNGADTAPKEAGYLLYEGGAYALNPAFPLLIDSDEFVARHEAGTRAGGAALLAEYEAACRLFTGPFLPDDLYADWSLIRREQLTRLYLTMCAALAARHLAASWYEDAADWALRILAENRCDEAAYRLLMQARARGGDRGEALRQYERCKATLDHELGVAPMPATVALFYTILRGDQLPDAGAGGA